MMGSAISVSTLSHHLVCVHTHLLQMSTVIQNHAHALSMLSYPHTCITTELRTALRLYNITVHM